MTSTDERTGPDQPDGQEQPLTSLVRYLSQLRYALGSRTREWALPTLAAEVPSTTGPEAGSRG
jgi:hypothetical protein